MKNTKISEIERLIVKYQERIIVIKSRPIYHKQWDSSIDDAEIDTLETIIEDLTAILN